MFKTNDMYKNKILSWVLAMALILSPLGLTAPVQAVTPDYSVAVGSFQGEGITGISGAFSWLENDAVPGESYTFTVTPPDGVSPGAIDYYSGVVISGITVTFELNGYTLNITNHSGTALEVGSGGAVSLSESGSLNVSGNDFEGHGVYAHDGGEAIVTNASASGGSSGAACATSGGVIEITGNASGTYTNTGTNTYCRAAHATGSGSQIIIGGNAASANNTSVYAVDGGYIEVGGDVSGFYRGADAFYNATIVIEGNVTASTEGAYASDGSTIYVGGDAIAEGDNGYGAYAIHTGSSVTVAGNAIARGNFGTGALAGYGGIVEVGGDAVSEGNDGNGVYATGTDAVIEVSGNVSAQNGTGVYCSLGGEVTVEGTITADDYIKLSKSFSEYVILAETDGEDSSGYRVYTYDTNTVRVKLSDSAAPVLTAGTVSRISDTEATVKFTSDEAGEYFYEVVPAGSPQPDIDTSGSGTACDTTEQTISLDSLTAGAKYIYIVVKDAAGNVSVPLFMDIDAYSAPTPGTIQFAASGHGTYEGYNGWEYAERIGGSDGVVTVDYATVDDTAIAGVHYAAKSGTLTWSDGDTANKAFPVNIYNDSTYNGYLNFSYVLSNPTGGAAIGEQNPLTVQLSDNDTPPVPAGLKAKAGNKKVDLSWDPVNSAYYKLYYATVNGEFTEDNSISVYDGVTYTMTELKNGTTYYFAIKAGHNIYFSDLSDTVSATPRASGGGGGGGGYTPPVKEEPVEEPQEPEITEPIYTPVDFDDVPAGAWFKEAVDFISGRGIAAGIGDNKFGPDMELTRGQFVVMLMNAFEISPQSTEDDLTLNFADAGNTYYTDYLLKARSLGIVSGVGEDLFAPDKAITRQEMSLMLYNALKVIDKLPAAAVDKEIDSFLDSDQIAGWAYEAMASLVKAGILSGSDDRLDPAATTSRAQMAQVLYKLLIN